jgi:preprotein translocase subunit SecF
MEKTGRRRLPSFPAGHLGLIVLPMAMLLASCIYLAYGYASTGEWITRSIELKGGTQISLSVNGSLDAAALEQDLSKAFGRAEVREYSSITGQGLLISLDSGADTASVLSFLEGRGLDASDASIQTIGPALGESFWQQAQMALLLSFVFMAIIVFIIFRTFVPSTAVILAAFSDIVVTMAVMQATGIELTLAGFGALLMLIGYSIDTDILLTTRVLKTTGIPVPERVRSAIKTGLTMTGTTLAALLALYVSAVSPVLSQIAAVLIIGLAVDVINTWMQNVAIITWHSRRRGL